MYPCDFQNPCDTNIENNKYREQNIYSYQIYFAL